jgi:NAD(P)-dependent dehydrogenase (short-subunit alcohol dehydrogenase family)
MLSPSLNGSTSQKKQSTNHMAIRVWFISGATRGIGTEIAKTVLVDNNQVVANDRKPEAVTKTLGTYL